MSAPEGSPPGAGDEVSLDVPPVRESALTPEAIPLDILYQDEFLAVINKPAGLAAVFINWILTDGQQYLDQAGYVKLSTDQQAESLAKLK